MDIVRLNNIWNVHHLEGKFREMGVRDTQIVQQHIERPLLPEGFDNLTKEYMDIYVAEVDWMRVSLFVLVHSAKQRRELREYTMTVYDDARFETI